MSVKKLFIAIIGSLTVLIIIPFMVFFPKKQFVKQEPKLPPKTSSVSQIYTCRTFKYKENFTIMLKSRQFMPEAEITSGLKWLKSYPGERAHVLLQLCSFLSPDEKLVLFEKYGIRILNYIPHNSWYASIPKDFKPDDSVLDIIRWFGPLLPEDKTVPQLLKDDVPPLALRDNNRVALDVSFFKDVSLDEAKKTIQKFNGKVVGTTSFNVLTVEIPKDAIYLLLKEDSIFWVNTVLPPLITPPEVID